MESKTIYELSTNQLKDYIDSHKEHEYLLIDVRQPEEYIVSHMPGAKLIPFSTIGTDVGELPYGIDLIFICRSGARSRAAAVLAADKFETTGKFYNLSDGLLSWDGKMLSRFPKVQALGEKNDFYDMLLAAMDLEKGAWNFYKSVLEKLPDAPFSDKIEYLSLAEADHAEALYNILIKKDSKLPEFEDMFHSMKGDILEGGISLDEALKSLDEIDSGSPLHILDLALDIEYSAFDLYRTAAELVDDQELKRILLGIATGEKNHMKKLAEAFALVE